MRKLILSLAALSMLASLTASAAPLSLVQNEYAFAKAAADHGVRDGFLMYLDKQAITLAPQPANAYDIYTKRKPSATKLSWYPSFALLSSSGDYGVDSGPWTANWIQDGKQQDAHGDWLTVWHRNKDGKWKVLFDGGVDHALPPKPPTALAKSAKVARLSAFKPTPSVDAVHTDLERAETVFSNTATVSSPRAAYEGQATDDIHLLQEGAQPLLGRGAVTQAASIQAGAVQWAPLGGSAAVSGDLGYIYGVTYKAKDEAHKSPLGSYMHVWKRSQDGWKLLIDLELPVPPR